MKRTENNGTDGSSSLLLDTINENELDIFPELIDTVSSAHKTILIKHNYYSSDNDHGRALLSAFLDVLSDESDEIAKIILIDSGAHLLVPQDPCHKKFRNIAGGGNIKLYCCRESLDRYADEEPIQDNIDLISAQSIALELLDSVNVITLE